MAMTKSKLFCREVLNEETGAYGRLHSALVKLFTNDITPLTDHVTADYTEVDSDWYEHMQVDFTGGYYSDDGVAEADGGLCQWIRGAHDDTDTVLGYFVTETDGTLIGAERFDEPQYMTEDGSEVSFVPRINLS